MVLYHYRLMIKSKTRERDTIYIVLPHLHMRISAFLPLALGLIVMLEGTLTFSVILSAALLHEAGHYFFIRLCNAKITRIDIEVLGALIVYKDGDTTLNADIAIAMGGILANITAATIGIICFTVYYNLYLLIFITANFALAFINLLPVLSLDGGKALSSLLFKRYNIDIAERVSRKISFAAKMVLLIISGLLVILSEFNTALIILFMLNFVQLNN